MLHDAASCTTSVQRESLANAAAALLYSGAIIGGGPDDGNYFPAASSMGSSAHVDQRTADDSGGCLAPVSPSSDASHKFAGTVIGSCTEASEQRSPTMGRLFVRARYRSLSEDSGKHANSIHGTSAAAEPLRFESGVLSPMLEGVEYRPKQPASTVAGLNEAMSDSAGPGAFPPAFSFCDPRLVVAETLVVSSTGAGEAKEGGFNDDFLHHRSNHTGIDDVYWSAESVNSDRTSVEAILAAAPAVLPTPAANGSILRPADSVDCSNVTAPEPLAFACFEEDRRSVDVRPADTLIESTVVGPGVVNEEALLPAPIEHRALRDKLDDSVGSFSMVPKAEGSDEALLPALLRGVARHSGDHAAAICSDEECPDVDVAGADGGMSRTGESSAMLLLREVEESPSPASRESHGKASSAALVSSAEGVKLLVDDQKWHDADHHETGSVQCDSQNGSFPEAHVLGPCVTVQAMRPAAVSSIDAQSEVEQSIDLDGHGGPRVRRESLPSPTLPYSDRGATAEIPPGCHDDEFADIDLRGSHVEPPPPKRVRPGRAMHHRDGNSSGPLGSGSSSPDSTVIASTVDDAADAAAVAADARQVAKPPHDGDQTPPLQRQGVSTPTPSSSTTPLMRGTPGQEGLGVEVSSPTPPPPMAAPAWRLSSP